MVERSGWPTTTRARCRAIDPRTRAVVQTIPAGTTPSGIAIGAGAVWVTNNYGQSVSRIDPRVNRVVQTIPVSNAPVGLAVGYGSVWVANSSDGTLSRIDAVTGAVTGTISLGGAGATDVAVGGGAVWVSDEAGDRVLRVDPQAEQVMATINVGSGPTAIGFAFGSVWVANSLDGTVSRIDPATDAVEATIEVGNGAGAIALGLGSVGVANQYAGTVSRIEPGTDMVARTIATGDLPQGLALAGDLVWVGSQATGSSHRGGTLTVLVQYWVTSLDPVFSDGIPGLDLTNDGLTAYRRVGGSGSMQLVPDLAVSLPSPTDGGTTYTFRLRRGIRYSNGELVIPEDFRLALQRDLTFGPDPATVRLRTSWTAPPVPPIPSIATCHGVWSSMTPRTRSPFTSSRPTPSSWPGSRLRTQRRCRARRTTTSAFTRSPPLDPTSSRALPPRPRASSCATRTSTSGRTRRVPTATRTGSCSVASPAARPRSPMWRPAPPTTNMTACLRRV